MNKLSVLLLGSDVLLEFAFCSWKCIFVLLPKFSCLILPSEASRGKTLREGIDDSGRWNSHYYFRETGSVLRNVVYQSIQSCFFCGVRSKYRHFLNFFVEYHSCVLNLWAGVTQYHLWYHPVSNGSRNLGCLNICRENATFGQPCVFWVLAGKLNMYRYAIAEARAVPWHRLYTVQFVKSNGDTQPHC